MMKNWSYRNKLMRRLTWLIRFLIFLRNDRLPWQTLSSSQTPITCSLLRCKQFFWRGVVHLQRERLRGFLTFSSVWSFVQNSIAAKYRKTSQIGYGNPRPVSIRRQWLAHWCDEQEQLLDARFGWADATVWQSTLSFREQARSHMISVCCWKPGIAP